MILNEIRPKWSLIEVGKDNQDRRPNMKKVMSIAIVALMMAGTTAFACDSCGCKDKKAEKKAECCGKDGKCCAEKKCEKCTDEKKCKACTKKCEKTEKAEAAE